MHLHNITLRHWDVSMRTLGAITLRSMLDLGQPQDVDDSMGREVSSLKRRYAHLQDSANSFSGRYKCAWRNFGLDSNRANAFLLHFSSQRGNFRPSSGADCRYSPLSQLSDRHHLHLSWLLRFYNPYAVLSTLACHSAPYIKTIHEVCLIDT